jgi:hypothetical protein
MKGNIEEKVKGPKHRILLYILTIILAITTLLIFIKLCQYDQTLVKKSGCGIVELELTYSPEKAQIILAKWQEEILPIARKSITWDWPFIISYVFFLTAFYFLTTGKFKEAFRRTWTVFAFFPLAAGIFDSLENFCLLHQLNNIGQLNSIVVISGSIFATLKFLLIALTILALINSWLIRRGGACYQVEDILEKELELIKNRREAMNIKDDSKDDSGKLAPNLFGIALSGGGIRSATINAGVLEILNKVGILPKADFLSTVSGGGYIGGYLHANLWKNQDQPDPYEKLFNEDDIKHLKDNGSYLTPGKKGIKFVSTIRLFGAVVFSMIMNWVWLLSFLVASFLFFQLLLKPIFQYRWFPIFFGITAALVFGYHFFLHPVRKLKLWSSNVLNTIEGFLVMLIIVYLVSAADVPSPMNIFIGEVPLLKEFFLTLLVLLVSALFYNPNILTMHRFYRDRLSNAYLETDRPGKKNKNLKLAQLRHDKSGPGRKWKAPYPLINTCLNLLGEDDEEFKGKKSSDYFLLSPLYCGSAKTGYVESESPVYRSMSLATAISVSGAAVNPNMGTRTKPITAFLMTLFNLKLGYWSLNPKKSLYHYLYTLWPYYLVSELFGKTHTKRWKINISDGGHIENLALYELLRRKCKLIIAIDAGADKGFNFNDLRNIVVRARNELGIAIKFRQDQDPEQVIKPKKSRGYSNEHFVIADIEELPKKENQKNKKIGLLVYLKSSLKAPLTKPKTGQLKGELKNSYIYKRDHADFPHESTGDQFFDQAQWEAHYYLGKFMAGDLLKIDDAIDETLLNQKREQFARKTIAELTEYFDGNGKKSGKSEMKKGAR